MRYSFYLSSMATKYKEKLLNDHESEMDKHITSTTTESTQSVISRISYVAVFGMCCVLVTIVEGIGFYGYYLYDTVDWTWFLIYYVSKSINIALACFVWGTSVYVQRKNLKVSKVYDGTMQSHLTNVILIFMAAMYFTTLGVLAFFKKDLIFQGIFNFGYAFGLLFVAAHLLGNLKWGTICTKYHKTDSVNWWCCIVSLFSTIYASLR